MNQPIQKATQTVITRFSIYLPKFFTALVILLQTNLMSAAQYHIINNFENYNAPFAAKLSAPALHPYFRLTKEAFLKKSRDQKTAAWCILGAGTIVLTVGLASYPGEGLTWLYSNAKNRQQADRATITTLAGAGLSLASIPFFVAAKKNKNSARLAISTQNTAALLPQGFARRVTGISFFFSAGKQDCLIIKKSRYEN